MKRHIKCSNDESKRLQQVYNLDRHAVDLLMRAQANLNTQTGYQAYYDLTKYIHEHKLSDEVLYDLAADFDWDDKLTDAVRKLAKADGYSDIQDWM